MLAKYGRGSISLQSPVPINLKWYECKTNFDFVMRKNLPIPF